MRLPGIIVHRFEKRSFLNGHTDLFIAVSFGFYGLPSWSRISHRIASMRLKILRLICKVMGHKKVSESCVRCYQPLWKV